MVSATKVVVTHQLQCDGKLLYLQEIVKIGVPIILHSHKMFQSNQHVPAVSNSNVVSHQAITGRVLTARQS